MGRAATRTRVPRTRDVTVAALPLLWSLLLALVLLWPLRHGLFTGGLPLGRDMVFTPHPPLGRDAVGLGDAPPRAVPVDAVVALTTHVLGAGLLARLALLVPLLLAGTGAAALVGRRHPVPGLVAATVAVWNPFVTERLAMGNWSLLWAYGALFWLVRALARARRGDASIGVVLLWAGAASLTPTGGVLAVAATLVVGVARTRRGAALAAGVIALQLCWIVPGLVGPSAGTSDAAAVGAFAARAEHPGGALLSVLGGGGAWNAAAAPASRAGWAAWLGLVVVAAAVVLGWRPAAALLGAGLRARLAWLAGGGLVLAVAGSTPGLDAGLRAVVQDVPGGGLLRDAQKWALPWMVLVAVLAGCAATRVTGAVVVRAGCWTAAVALPFLTLPDATRPVHAVLAPVHYPADWRWAAAATRTGGEVAVLPFQPYRAFAWAPGRPVLDPAPRLLDAPAVVSDRLTVGGRTLAGDDAHAAAVGRALADRADPRTLARLGVGWVLVERGTPGAVPALDGLQRVRSGADLVLLRVPGPVRERAPGTARTAVVLGADALALAVLAVAIGLCVRSQRRC